MDSRWRERRVVVTGDGSRSIFLPACQESYHSCHGAWRESQLVFLANGYDAALAAFGNSLRILEVGFGTGLNALLTWERARQTAVRVFYTALEPFPLPLELALELDYGQALATSGACDAFLALHRCRWNVPVCFGERFSLLKRSVKVEDLEAFDEAYELIYFDAFAPAVQPELWTRAVFEKLYRLLRGGGVLVTYCAKGAVKRHLKAVGFLVESLAGPPGKREVTRARRP
ncbi:MAG: SAM-dependent methyltransferase [Burkholderiaceae bacterium]|nr:MAG: SAM-dependent methyltransferase [Burkholderiaceae bacterium]